jgi:hypothetical protein
MFRLLLGTDIECFAIAVSEDSSGDGQVSFICLLLPGTKDFYVIINKMY